MPRARRQPLFRCYPLSSAEAIAGAVTVDAERDASVAVTFTSATDSGRTVTVMVTGTGSAQPVILTAGDLTTLGEGTINVSAVATDQAGNPSEASTASFDLDTTAPTIGINAVATDDVVNAAEKTMDVVVSGTTDAEDGRTVTVNWGGATETTTASGSVWAVTYAAANVPTDAASTTITANVSDTAGNPAVPATHTVRVDTAAPTITTTALSVAENTTTVGNLAATDTNSVTRSFAGTGADESLFSIASDGALTLNTAANFEAPGSSGSSNIYAIDAIATDMAGNSSTQSIAVTVTDVNETPTYVGASGNDSISIADGSDVNIDLQSLFNNPDSNALTYTVGAAGNPLPGTLVLSSTGGVISGTANPGPYDGIIISVSDGTLSVEHTFSLDVVV